MIVDNLANAARYFSLHPLLKKRLNLSNKQTLMVQRPGPLKLTETA